MLVSSFMHVKTAKQFLNQKKEIAVSIVPMEQYHVHQFRKTDLVVNWN